MFYILSATAKSARNGLLDNSTILGSSSFTRFLREREIPMTLGIVNLHMSLRCLETGKYMQSGKEISLNASYSSTRSFGFTE